MIPSIPLVFQAGRITRMGKHNEKGRDRGEDGSEWE